MFFIQDFFHTALRHTCWKWVDISTLIQLISFNHYSTLHCSTIFENWKKYYSTRKPVDSSHLISTFTTEFHQPFKIGWVFQQRAMCWRSFVISQLWFNNFSTHVGLGNCWESVELKRSGKLECWIDTVIATRYLLALTISCQYQPLKMSWYGAVDSISTSQLQWEKL